MMRKDSRGFTLVELMVVMLITMFVLYAATQTLGALVIQFKQQAKITDTNISSILGLEILRRDIHGAGYGLPYSDRADYDSANNSDGRGGGSPIPYTFETINYQETLAGVALVTGVPVNAYNDAPSGPPRAITSDNGVGPNGSDYLVIKSMGVSVAPAAGKFHILRTDGTASSYPPDPPNLTNSLNLTSTDRVIVIAPDQDSYTLISSGNYYTTFGIFVPGNTSFRHKDFARIIYGVDGNAGDDGTETLRAPFNRADYYISYRNVPERCAHMDALNPPPAAPGDPSPTDRTGLANPGTGVLVKAIMDHADGDFDADADGVIDEIPILDCVADFKIVYGLDSISTDTNLVNSWAEDTDAVNDPADVTPGQAFDIRRQVREVHVHILAHEGAFSPDFIYDPDADGVAGPSTVDVGESGMGHVGPDIFDVTTMDPRWQNFRWKVYRLTVKPVALR